MQQHDWRSLSAISKQQDKSVQRNRLPTNNGNYCFSLRRSNIGRASRNLSFGFVLFVISSACLDSLPAQDLKRIKYNHPGLVVDLGVGLWAWPLPMDYDGDGDLDLVVSCPDKPYNGTYFFENTEGATKLPIFQPARRISSGKRNVHVSYIDGEPHVLGEGREFHLFKEFGLDKSRKLPLRPGFHKLVGIRSERTRGHHWSYCDYEGDGNLDLLIGIGDWSDYGWDDAYNSKGNWTHGPLHGFVYLARNQGSDASPEFAEPEPIKAGEKPIDVYGRPAPNYVDFDGDGDADLLCGEFLDGFTYYENVGSREEPRFAVGRRLRDVDNAPLSMDLQMIVPVAIDWDSDGDQDLIVGDEDGRVALIEHSGKVRDNLPVFHRPIYFQQVADNVMCGALSTPVGIDWDQDGDEDLLCGNTAGYVVFFENLGLHDGMPKWAAPEKLSTGTKVIRIQAGANGSIQGPCEAKWGYTTLTAGDWDHDGLTDVVLNSIWGKILWYRNIGTRSSPRLMDAQPVQVNWQGEPQKPDWFWWTPNEQDLVTQWRTTPVVYDWNQDGRMDLVMLDYEGYLCLFPRSPDGASVLRPKRIFLDDEGKPIRLNNRRAGGSGRRKLAVTDWDRDGKVDILVNSENANWLRQIERPSNVAAPDFSAKRAGSIKDDEGHCYFADMGPLGARKISSHTTSPTVVDWNGDRIPDLVVGAEDGFLYYLENQRN